MSLRVVREQVRGVREQVQGLVRLEEGDDELEALVRLEEQDEDDLQGLVKLERYSKLEDGIERITKLEADEPADDDDEGPEDEEIFDGIDFVKLEGLDLDDVSGLGAEGVRAVEQFQGFWSSVTKGFKKASHVVAGVAKITTKGITSLGKVTAKVGKFVVETPTLRRMIEAAAVPFTGPAGPALLEIAASAAQQHMRATKGKPKVARLAAQAVKAGATKTKDLPARKYSRADIADLLRKLHNAGPVRTRIAQRMVRAGIPVPLTVSIVLEKDERNRPACPSVSELRRMAALASIAVQGATGELGGLADLQFRV